MGGQEGWWGDLVDVSLLWRQCRTGQRRVPVPCQAKFSSRILMESVSSSCLFDPKTKLCPTASTISSTPTTMPPKYVTGGRRVAPKGYFRSTYDTLTSSENAAVVKSIAAFGVSNPVSSATTSFGSARLARLMLTTVQAAVTFLSSNWAEWILVFVSPQDRSSTPG